MRAPCYSAVVNQVKTISFVGAGALASGLAKLLRAQGFTIGEIIARPSPGIAAQGRARWRATVGAAAATLAKAGLDCDLLVAGGAGRGD